MSADGPLLAARVGGDGAPLVLINGYAATKDDWDPRFIAALGRDVHASSCPTTAASAPRRRSADGPERRLDGGGRPGAHGRARHRRGRRRRLVDGRLHRAGARRARARPRPAPRPALDRPRRPGRGHAPTRRSGRRSPTTAGRRASRPRACSGLLFPAELRGAGRRRGRRPRRAGARGAARRDARRAGARDGALARRAGRRPPRGDHGAGARRGRAPRTVVIPAANARLLARRAPGGRGSRSSTAAAMRSWRRSPSAWRR